MTEESNFDFDKSINFELSVDNTPIKDYMKSVIEIFDNLKFVKNIIEKKLVYVLQHTKYMVVPSIEYLDECKSMRKECGKMLGDIIVDIKTFWEIFGSIMLPIRNYLPMIQQIYSTIKDSVEIDLLDTLFDISKEYAKDDDVKNGETTINIVDHKLSKNEFANLIDGFSTLIVSTEKLSYLNEISENKIDDINWSFKTLLMTSVDNFVALDNSENIGVKVSKECKSSQDEFDYIISNFVNKISVMCEYVMKKNLKSVLNVNLHDFICAVINISLYKLYEELKQQFVLCFKGYATSDLELRKCIKEEKAIEG